MGEEYTLYGYSPNKGAPIAFCVFFAITTVVHIWQNIKFKSWKITGALPWGGMVFVAGFAMREVSIYNVHSLEDFVAYQCLLLIAPPVYSLTNYLILGRTLYYVPYFSPIHPGRVISTFVGLDLLIGILTGNGAREVSDLSHSPERLKVGEGLLRTSILLQVVAFVGFITLTVILHRRCLRAEILNRNLEIIIRLVYISSAMILTRNIYRVVEVFGGYNSYLYNHEAFFYVFDGALMLLNSVMLNIYHPMTYLPHSNKVYLARDGVTELEGPGWVDKRNFFATIIDPFDIGGLISGKDKTDRFWENDGIQNEGGLESVREQ